jgi:fructokinase
VAHQESKGDDVAPYHPPFERGRTGRPLIFGEVLYDVFPGGDRVLGGAPFNVAWHLQAFGLRPLVVTRIGDDRLGVEILEAMLTWGMDRSGVQIDPDADTGQVRVDFDAGAPRFTILPDQAYDRLDAEHVFHTLSKRPLALLYHGSLIARSSASREVLEEVRARLKLPVFVDVNLRDPWWSESTVDPLLAAARWVKLNDDELVRLAGAVRDRLEDAVDGLAAGLARRHRLSDVVVTRGADGALVWRDGDTLAARPPRAVEVVDTVGAGDAFSAVWIIGLIREWPVQEALRRALAFAADICSFRGATTRDRDLYRKHMESWEDE